MEFNLWWLFFSMSAGIGFFGSLLLLAGPSKKNPGSKALGFLLLIFSLTLVHYVMVWSGNIANFPHLSGLWRASSYLYGPLLLFYIVGNKPKWKIAILHFIPFLILFIAWLPFGISTGEEKLLWMQTWSPYSSDLLISRSFLYLLHPVFMVGSQLIYCLYFYWLVRKLKNGNQKIKTTITHLFLVFILAQISYFLLIKSPSFKPEWDYMISMAMTLCIFRIALYTFQQPEYFFKLKKRSPLEGKYTTSPLSNGQSEKLALSIKTFVESNQSYLDSELRLPLLAKKLELNSHQVSQAINENFNCSFSEWINLYRVEHACQLLITQEVSAKEAGYQSGFNSLSTFYQIFKKEKGMTPAKYSKLQSTA